MVNKRMIDITGQRFGKLVVSSISNERNSFGDILWDCICDCGNKKKVVSGALRHGLTRSCGCMQGSPTHGDSNKRIRIIWVNMMRRCYSIKDKQYPNYGGRGIKVCGKWHDYATFKLWAFDNGYKDDLTIDRINVNKSYTPLNCRWATQKEQNNNRRNNTRIKINGVTKTVSQWCEVFNIKQSRVWKRVNRGWSIMDAIMKPKRKYPNKNATIRRNTKIKARGKRA